MAQTQKKQQDMGTGDVKKLLLQLMIPAVVAQVVNLLYNIVDRIYIGHISGIGAAALTGRPPYNLGEQKTSGQCGPRLTARHLCRTELSFPAPSGLFRPVPAWSAR